ncbi:MAG TPA: MFS transporter [Candidatus Acidoferrum sp.]|nr:MFS transporter [Candidatus Acidoferrum sp.]
MSSMSTEGAPAPVQSRVVGLVAVACAITVANIYWAQPLLVAIGHEFDAGAAQLGAVAALTQFGYALGIVALVPLGDSIDPRRLVLLLLGLVTAALLACAAAPSLIWLAFASFVLGCVTVIPQILIPYVAALASPEARGRVIGSAQSGLIVGILGARALAGMLESALGWRSIFVIAAVASAVLTVVLLVWLPPRARAGSPATSYLALLRSLPSFLQTLPALREACLFGALAFAGFSGFWTTIALFVAAHPIAGALTAHLPPSAIVGALALVAIVSAFVAPLIGRFADRRGPLAGNGIALALVTLGFLALLGATAPHWALVALVAGVVLLDIGMQGNQISNQTRILSLSSGAGSRLNTVYMAALFLGGAVGSTLGATAWNRFGWHGVCGLGIIYVVVALPVYARAVRRARADVGSSAAA